jgi:hypothetical protein
MTDAWKSLTGAERPIGFSDVYAFATGLEQPTQALRQALLRDRRLRSALDRLLDKTSLYRFPKVAAASSGAIEGRDGDNYKIRLKVSQAAPRQTYVIIEFRDLVTNPPSAILFSKPDGEYNIHPLPEPDGKIIQILTDSDSALVTALRNVDTEVYLR